MTVLLYQQTHSSFDCLHLNPTERTEGKERGRRGSEGGKEARTTHEVPLGDIQWRSSRRESFPFTSTNTLIPLKLCLLDLYMPRVTWVETTHLCTVSVSFTAEL